MHNEEFGAKNVDGLDKILTYFFSSSYSQDFCNLITWILKVDPNERPTVQEVEHLIGTILSKTNPDV